MLYPLDLQKNRINILKILVHVKLQYQPSSRNYTSMAVKAILYLYVMYRFILRLISPCWDTDIRTEKPVYYEIVAPIIEEM